MAEVVQPGDQRNEVAVGGDDDKRARRRVQRRFDGVDYQLAVGERLLVAQPADAGPQDAACMPCPEMIELSGLANHS